MSDHESTEKAASPERVTLPILDAVTLTLSVRQILSESRERFGEIGKVPLEEVSVANILDAWDSSSIAMDDVIGPVSILNSVHPSRAVRDAGDEALIQFSSFSTELFQSEALYERVRRVIPQTAAQRQLQKDLLEAFEDSGVSLAAEKRSRFREISDRLTELSQEFERNIRDDAEKLTFSPDEYRGVPESYLDRVPRDSQGHIVVGFDSPDYNPFMMTVANEAARKRYYIGYNTRGVPRNLELLDEIVRLRRELAGLYDLPSFAHYATRRGMVGNPETVLSFLAEVKKTVEEIEEGDLEELRALKAEMNGTPLAGTTIHRWDVSYYKEQLRSRRFAIDQEGLRSYFPTAGTLDWILAITSDLYGVEFRKVSVPIWHEDVLYYDVFEPGTGVYIGGIYLDLFPRDGKYKHAAAWPVRSVSRRIGRTPVSVLVTNFDRIGLTHEELETFLHEFGHVLHGVLSETVYSIHAGTSVEQDFVEAPSQMYEEWGRRIESLSRLHSICPSARPLEPELVSRLNDARALGRGIHYARQHLYASFDMLLAGENPPQTLELWRTMESQSLLGHVEGTAFPASFGHIAADYAAAYYGYMWSEVIALDMLSAFGGDLMNPLVGRRFRRAILSRGGEEPASALVREFLGRDPGSGAFFDEVRGKRRSR